MAISLHYDLQVAIEVAHSCMYNGKKRQIRTKHGVVKHMLKHRSISMKYVRSKRNLADSLTKGLIRRIVLETSRGMGLKPMD